MKNKTELIYTQKFIQAYTVHHTQSAKWRKEEEYEEKRETKKNPTKCTHDEFKSSKCLCRYIEWKEMKQHKSHTIENKKKRARGTFYTRWFARFDRRAYQDTIMYGKHSNAAKTSIPNGMIDKDNNIPSAIRMEWMADEIAIHPCICSSIKLYINNFGLSSSHARNVCGINMYIINSYDYIHASKENSRRKRKENMNCLCTMSNDDRDTFSLLVQSSNNIQNAHLYQPHLIYSFKPSKTTTTTPLTRRQKKKNNVWIHDMKTTTMN